MSKSKEVFVTSHGTAYHRPYGHFFTGSGKRIVLRSTAVKLGYVPCQYCFPGEKPTVVRPRRDGSKQFRALSKGINNG